MNVVDACGPAAATDVALAVCKDLIAVTRAYRSIERVVDRDLDSGVLPVGQLDIDADDMVAAVPAAAVHAGSFSHTANHYILDIASRLILNHLLQLRIHLRSARSRNGDVAVLGGSRLR